MTDTAYTVQKGEAVVYTITGKAKGYGRIWANVTIQEWKARGEINIACETWRNELKGVAA